MTLEDIVKEIIEKNEWLSGWHDYREGDVMAIVNEPEKYQHVTEETDIRKLYESIKNYDGAFKHKNLLLFSHWNYGVFVYNVNNTKHYIEHLTINAMTFEDFAKLINNLN